MSKQLITREYNGNVFTFREDGYFNMTDAAKKFGKDLQVFIRRDDTVEYIDALSKTVPDTELVQAKAGRNGGTWAHPKLAVFFARWLDVKFAVFCDTVIDDILSKKAEVTFTPQATAPKIAKTHLDTARELVAALEEVARLEEENKEMAPKAVVFDNCVALRQESLATFVRTLEGVNTMAIKGDLADLGYLYRTVGAGKYRVYAKYRDVLFIEKLIAQLYLEGKLTMKKGFAA